MLDLLCSCRRSAHVDGDKPFRLTRAGESEVSLQGWQPSANTLPKGTGKCSSAAGALVKEMVFYRRTKSLGKTLLQNLALLFSVARLDSQGTLLRTLRSFDGF